MKLLLVDTSDVHIFFWNKHRMIVTVDREVIKLRVRIPDQTSRDEDSVRNRRISNILTENIGSVSFELHVNSETGRLQMELSQAGDDHRDCLFENLRDRFQDEVKISLFLKYAANKNAKLSDFISMQGMEIEGSSGKRLVCNGSTISNKKAFDPAPAVHVQIIAEVPDQVEHPAQLLSVKRILEEGSFSDVTILCENDRKIKAHKCFLAISSPVFQAMFQSWTEESKTGQIDMSDSSKESVESFLRYIYYGDLELPQGSIKIAFELFQAAEKYNIQELRDKMITILMQRRNDKYEVRLALKMYMFTRNMEPAIELKAKSRQILKEKYHELEELHEYKDFFRESPDVAFEVVGDFMKSSWT